jgi:Xaa-Pro aminopeptidase
MIIEKAAEELKRQGAQYLYLSSFDVHLSEYVPANDSLRRLVSNFTGSVAEVIVSQSGHITLFVDGRYHEQADRECLNDYTTVVKVPYGETLKLALFNWLKEEKIANIHYLDERTPWSLKTDFEKTMATYKLDCQAFYQAIGFNAPSFNGEAQALQLELTGESSVSKCTRLIESDEIVFVSGLDTIAWLTNCRSYQIPFQSTFRAVALGLTNEVHLFTDSKIIGHEDNIIVYPHSEWKSVANRLQHLKKIRFDQTYTSVKHYDDLLHAFPQGTFKQEEKPLAYDWHAIKNEAEIKVFEESFEHSDRAIFNSFNWLINKVNKDQQVSEEQFRDMAKAFYEDEGAHGQSFSILAGFGANSSIIHYSKPSADVFYEKGANVLLDSGSFYDGGLATDCTRTFAIGAEPEWKRKKYYTLVLKSLLALMNLSVPKGTTGKEIDDIARKPIKEAGYDYAHGTGHGVGVNVHETGYAITPFAEHEIRVGTVGSIEPGLYVADVGGVRLENVVVVIEDPDNSDNIRFRNLVFIGFCSNLIDESLLSDEEKNQLMVYEEQCQQKGRSFLGV